MTIRENSRGRISLSNGTKAAIAWACTALIFAALAFFGLHHWPLRLGGALLCLVLGGAAVAFHLSRTDLAERERSRQARDVERQRRRAYRDGR